MHIENNISNRRVAFSEYENSKKGHLSYPVAYANIFYPYIYDSADYLSNCCLTICKKKKNKITDGHDERNYEWFFKESKNPNRESDSISNCFVFSGQKSIGKIECEKSITGTFSGIKGFAKTKLKVLFKNLVSGSESEILSFDSSLFSSKTFEVEAPVIDNDFYSEFGLSGLCCLSIYVRYDIYEDQSQKNILIEDLNGGQHNMQLLVFSPAIEAKNVEHPFEIFKEEIIGDETPIELFEKSVFVDYIGAAPEPTDGHKRAMILDQIASLFISQHPVVTSDNYPSKIIGFGVAPSSKKQYSIKKPLSYPIRYNKNIPMINDRFFSLPLNYKTFCYKKEIDKYFSGFDQSEQCSKEPFRISCIDESGALCSEFGENGMILNPFIVTNTNCEINEEYDEESIFEVRLTDNSISVENIRFSDPDFVENLPIRTLSPFNNSLLSCPLDIDYVVEQDVNANKMYVKSINALVFPQDKTYNTFEISNVSGTLTSKTTLYTLGENENVKLVFNATDGCYFTIEAESEDKKWVYKSNGYRLNGKYLLSSYSSTKNEPNPFSIEKEIQVISLGEFSKDLYQYISYSNNKVKISFDVKNGENIIKKIKYNLWSKSSNCYLFYETNDVSSRNYTFDLSTVGGIKTTFISGKNTPTDYFAARIDIEDVYGNINMFYKDHFVPENNQNPVIIKPHGIQMKNGSKSIEIKYMYLGTSEINNTKISLQWSLDNISWQNATNVSGDVGIAVNPGVKTIKYNTVHEIDAWTSKEVSVIYFRIFALDVDLKHDMGPWENIGMAVPVSYVNPSLKIKISREDQQ